MSLIGGQPPSLPELTARYQRQTAVPASEHEAWLNWIVRFEGQAVGFVQATLRQEEGVLCASVAWLIRPEDQGRGLATEAAGVMVEHLRSEQGVRWVTWGSVPGGRTRTRLSASML